MPYSLLLFLAAGGERIVDCEADDDPRQIARDLGATIYGQFASREEAERHLAQDMNAQRLEHGKPD